MDAAELRQLLLGGRNWNELIQDIGTLESSAVALRLDSCHNWLIQKSDKQLQQRTLLFHYTEERAGALQTPGLDHDQVWRISIQCEHKDEAGSTWDILDLALTSSEIRKSPIVADGQMLEHK